MLGTIPRIGNDPTDIIGKYSATKEAMIRLDLQSGETELRVTRRHDGEEEHLLLEVDGESLRGAAASARLLGVSLATS